MDSLKTFRDDHLLVVTEDDDVVDEWVIDLRGW
jgi:hypothetical protein